MSNESHFVRVTVSGMARDPRDNPVVLLKSDEGDDVLKRTLPKEGEPAIVMERCGLRRGSFPCEKDSRSPTV